MFAWQSPLAHHDIAAVRRAGRTIAAIITEAPAAHRYYVKAPRGPMVAIALVHGTWQEACDDAEATLTSMGWQP